MKRVTNLFNKKMDVAQKKFKLDMKYFSNGTFWLGFSHVGIAILSILFTVILTKYLSKNDYGLFQLILSILGFIGAFTSLNGAASVIKTKIARGFDGTYKSLSYWSLICSLIGTIPLLVCIIYFYYFKGFFWEIFVFLLFYYPISRLFYFSDSFFIGKKKFQTTSIIKIIKKVIITSGTALVAILTLDVFYILVTYFMLDLIVGGFVYLYSRRFVKNENKDKGTLMYALNLSLVHIPSFFTLHTDKLLLGYFFGLAAVAEYSIISLIALQVTSLNTILRNMFIPKFSENKKKSKLLQEFNKKSKYLFLINVSLLTIIAIFTPIVMEYLFPKYTNVTIYIYLMMIGSVFLFTNSGIMSYLISTDNKKDITRIMLSVSISYLILQLVLIPIYGILGAIIAYIGKEFFKTAYLKYSTR